jgi:tRNA(fMet)-specific endonuclease VapC
MQSSELKQLLNNSRVRLTPVDDGTAEFYAHIYLCLKTQGAPIPTNDLWIASSALQHGLGLISLERHFVHVAGLIVIPLS